MQLFTISNPKVTFNPNIYSYSTYSSYGGRFADLLELAAGTLTSESQFSKIDIDPQPTILQQTADDKEFVLKLFAPNFKASDIDVSVEPNGGDVVVDMDNKKGKPVYFRLTFLQDYDLDQIKSTLREEVLTIKIPFKETAKPRKIRID
jgi:HSP20 family molecular chaperone IbpA